MGSDEDMVVFIRELRGRNYTACLSIFRCHPPNRPVNIDSGTIKTRTRHTEQAMP